MPQEAPRGVTQQAAAVSELLTSGFEADRTREDEPADAPNPQEVPEQIAPGESLAADEIEAGSEAAEGEGEAPSGGEIHTLMDFAKAAGWDPQDVYALAVKLDTGEEIPLGQLKDKLQSYGRQEAELAAKREELNREQDAMRQQAQAFFSGQQQLSKAAQEAQGRMIAIEERYKEIEWDKLRAADPARYAALHQDFGIALAGARQQFEAAQAQQQQAQRQHYHTSLVEHDRKFLSMVPEWKDEKVAAREGPEISKFLMDTIGFRPEELTAIFDSRARVVGRMAWLWAQHQKQVASASERVRQAPKPVMRPGAGQDPGTSFQRRTDALVQQAKTTRSRKDQEAAATALLISAGA